MRRLTRAPKDILEAAAREALYVAVNSTTQDSGNAAWHWTIVGFRGSDVPDARRVPFDVRYGDSPVGEQGDKGATSEAVINEVLDAGYAIIHDMVWRQGRVAFTIYNDMVNSDFASNDYLTNAGVNSGMMTKVAAAALERARLAASKSRYNADQVVPNEWDT